MRTLVGPFLGLSMALGCQSATGPLIGTKGPFTVHAASLRTRSADTRSVQFEIMVRNKTSGSQELCEIRMSRDGKWTDNLLLSGCVKPDGRSVVMVPVGGRWDLRVVADDGATQFVTLDLETVVTHVDIE